MAVDGLVEINAELVVSANGSFAMRAAAFCSFVLVVFEVLRDVFDHECRDSLLMRPVSQLRTDRRVHLAHCEFRFFSPVVPDELSPETNS